MAVECTSEEFQTFRDGDEDLNEYLITKTAEKQKDNLYGEVENAPAAMDILRKGAASAYTRGGMAEFPTALAEFLSILVNDEDVGGGTVGEVLSKLYNLEEHRDDPYCFRCKGKIDLICYSNNEVSFMRTLINIYFRGIAGEADKIV